MTKCARIHLHPKVFRGLVHSASIKFILHDKMQISSQNSSWHIWVAPQVEGFFIIVFFFHKENSKVSSYFIKQSQQYVTVIDLKNCPIAPQVEGCV